ncbi:MAG: hypothetical protein CM15mP18_4860 [Methanobacteriota archaeon]|nr:MAG: hypothetical protein CM15mP18_4860 [Euryarchaeota archaeon]
MVLPLSGRHHLPGLFCCFALLKRKGILPDPSWVMEQGHPPATMAFTDAARTSWAALLGVQTAVGVGA